MIESWQVSKIIIFINSSAIIVAISDIQTFTFFPYGILQYNSLSMRNYLAANAKTK